MSLTPYSHPFASYCQKVLIALWENEIPFTYRHLEDRVQQKNVQRSGYSIAFPCWWTMAGRSRSILLKLARVTICMVAASKSRGAYSPLHP